MPYSDPDEQAKYQREWMASRRQKWLDEHGPCVRCGSWNRLEVDHIDPSKKVSHSVWSWSKKRRDEELAKCQVLCHDHHVEKTWKEEGRPQAQHGSGIMYKKYKCRCSLCRAYKSRENAKRKR